MRAAILATLILSLCSTEAGVQSPPPVDVFAEWNGHWAGTFVGYDMSGKELYRISVKQRYTRISDTEQSVEIEDRMADGKVITGTGKNVARRLPDGSLELRCVVAKSDGDRVEHRGRLVRGPSGQKEIVWHSDAPGRTETFREGVRKGPKGTTYFIHGMGIYGGKPMLMAGEYCKQEKPTPARRRGK